MNAQLNFEEVQIKKGEELRDDGIKRAIDHAEDVSHGWGNEAFRFLRFFLNVSPLSKSPFMGETVRTWAEDRGLVSPPHLRAWAAVIVRAARLGMIRKIGSGQVINPKAHRAYATLWEKVG